MNDFKYFIGVGDGNEGYSGNWAEFYKCKEIPDDATPQLVEVTRDVLVKQLIDNQNYLKVVTKMSVEEIEILVDESNELYIRSNGSDDYILAENLNELAEEYDIDQPGYNNDEDDDEEDD